MGSLKELDVIRAGGIFDDLGLTAFFRKARARIWLLIPALLVWIALSKALFWLLPVTYSATMEVAAVTLTNPAPASGGLAGLVSGGVLGGALGSTNDPLFTAYRDSWTSSWFAANLAKNDGLLRRLFPGEWSPDGWRAPEDGLLRTSANFIKMILGAPQGQWKPPDTERALEYLQRHIRVDQPRGSVIMRVVYTGQQREAAADLLTTGHATISDYLRNVFRARARANADYLLGELKQVQVTDYREALIRELEEQEKVLMLTSPNTEFVAQPLGLYVGDSPVSPRAASTVISAFILSLLAWVAFVFIGDWLAWPAIGAGWWSPRRVALNRSAPMAPDRPVRGRK